MRSRLRVHFLAIMLIAITVCTLATLNAPSASAQAPGLRVVINSIETARFPEVQVRFQVFDAEGQFVNGLTDFTLTENAQPVEGVAVKVSNDQPIRVVFLLDLGRSSPIRMFGQTGQTRIREFLKLWADSAYFRDGIDTVSIIASGAQANLPMQIVLPPTQSLDEFAKAVDTLNLTPGPGSQTFEPLQRAIATAAEIAEGKAGTTNIVYLTRTIDSSSLPDAMTTVQTMGAEAREKGIRIQALHIDTRTGVTTTSRALQALTTTSGGEYVKIITTDDSATAAVRAFFGKLAAPGKVYVATYRSKSGQSGERTVSVAAAGDSGSTSNANYTVTLQPPTIAITEPKAGFAIKRTATEPAASPEQLKFDVTSAPVRFTVTWADKLPRKLTQAELLVGDNVAVTATDLLPIEPVGSATPEAAPVSDPIIQTYEIRWDLSAIVREGANAQRLAIRLTDEFGAKVSSPAVEGNVTVEVPVTAPEVALVSPAPNSTTERLAKIDTQGKPTGYETNEISLTVRLTWPTAKPGNIAAADILVDSKVVSTVPFPALTPVQGGGFSGQDKAITEMTLKWDISAVTNPGPNLYSIQVQVRDDKGNTAITPPATLNVQVIIPQLELPTVFIVVPESGGSISRVAVRQQNSRLEFLGESKTIVVAGIAWPDNQVRKLAVAELLVNNVPLGTEQAPSLLSESELGQGPSQLGADVRFFRITWDISSIQNPGANLQQLVVRVRDEAGIEAKSDTLTVNVQVDVLNPPEINIASPANNSTITRTGKVGAANATPTFELNTVNVDATISWAAHLPFDLNGLELVTNGNVVTTAAPADIAQIKQTISELPDGSRRVAVRLPWDVSGIQKEGANLIQLQVRVKGSANIVSESAPVNLNVQVEVPLPLPPNIRITAPVAGSTQRLDEGKIAVVVEITWPNNEARDLQFLELSVDNRVVQNLLSPKGTRFELEWEVPANIEAGITDHQVAVRLRDTLGIEAIGGPVSFKVNIPAPTAVIRATATQAAAVAPPAVPVIASQGCPAASLSEGWDNPNCLRERAVLLIPIGGVLLVLVGGVVILRRRATRPAAKARAAAGKGGVIGTMVAELGTTALGYLEIVQGPPNMLGKKIYVYMGKTIIGRDPSLSSIVLYPNQESTISTKHCTITYENGKFTLQDEKSTNGTFLNGKRITSVVPLKDGDDITLGVPAQMGALIRFRTTALDAGGKADQGSGDRAMSSPPRGKNIMDRLLDEITDQPPDQGNQDKGEKKP